MTITKEPPVADTPQASSPDATPPAAGERADRPTKLVALVLGFAAVIATMLFAFAAPALNSGAADLPLAVSGPEPAVTQLVATLEQQSPGTFDITTYSTAQDGAAAITERDAIGGIALGADGVTIQTAQGAGTPYAALLNGVGAQLESAGQAVTYDELAPTTADDPNGSGISSLGMPLIFGGMGAAAAMVLAYRGPARNRLLAATGLAVLGGLTATAILQFGFGAFDGSYWLIASAVTAGIVAISFPVLGLAQRLGTAGIGLMAAVLMFVANPLSGLATGAAWLPQPWGEIGQYLPIGAAGTAIRSAAYFDGAGATQAWIVLAVWALAGLALALAGSRRGAHRSAHAAAAA